MKGIISLMLLVGAAIGIQQFAFPAITKIQEDRAQLTDMEDLERQAIQAVGERDKAIARLKEAEEYIPRLNLILPEKPAEEDLYVFFDTVVRQAGFSRIDSIRVAEVSAKKVGDTTGTANKKTLAFELSVTGSYHIVRELLTILEKSARLSDVRAIDMTLDAKKGYIAKIQGNVYYAN